MANQIRFKRASGSDPSASDLAIGEPGLRTDTAELFFKKDDGTIAKVSGGGGGPDFKYLELRNAANNGAASYPGNDFTLVSAGTTTAVSPAAAATLLVSVSGVIQKPNSGTSTSGITGFIVDGSRFKTATNLPAAPDFIIYQESGGIGEPSDNTVTSAKIVDGAIVNADINASAAIALTKLGTGNLPNTISVLTANIAAGQLVTGHIAAGTGFQISNSNVSNSAAIAGSKISPDFGSQNIVTTGTLQSDNMTISGTAPKLDFVDTNANSDFRIIIDGGVFYIQDTTNSNATRLTIGSDGQFDFEGNVDCNNGLDVTGAISSTGNLTITNEEPKVLFVDSGHNPDYQLQNTNGTFKIKDATNGIDRFKVNSDGHIDIQDNLDVGNGIDVLDGDITLASGHTVDGRDVSADGSKLDGIESGATADQTKSDIDALGIAAATATEATNVTAVANNTTNTAYRVPFLSAATGTSQLQSDNADGMTYNPSTGTLIATAFNGNGAALVSVNAATLDSLDSTQFARSDAEDTITGKFEFTTSGSFPIKINGSDNAKIKLSGSSNPYIRWQEGTTDKAYIQWNAGSGFLGLYNQEDSSSLKIQDDIRFSQDGSTYHKVWHAGNDGAGSGLDADTLDGISSASFVRSDASDTMTGTLTLAESSSNQKLVLSGTNDPYIRFQEGTTNKAYIQWHSDGYINLVNSESSESLRIQSGSSGLKFVEGGNVRNVYHTGNLGVGDGFLSENNFTDALKNKLDGIATGATVGLPTSGGTLTGTLNARAIVPTANNTYDLGTSSNRWRNLYTNDLNLSNEGGANDVDGTWGSFTIQEGAEDLFLINKRNGKKYKINLTEVS